MEQEKKHLLANIHAMLEPWIKKGEEENYFRVRSYFSNGDKSVLSKGLLMSGSKDMYDKIAFEVSFLHESTQSMYRTINCKSLESLNVEDLRRLQEAVTEYVKKDQIVSAVLRDYYSDTISSENEWFTSVDFGRPVDGELYEISEYIEARDKKEAVFPDFDGAIYYAEAASLALERRGKHWGSGDGYFHVTVESVDPRIPALAKEYDGIAIPSEEEGVALTMATFRSVATARRYSEMVNRMLDTELFRKSPHHLLESYLIDKLKGKNSITLDSLVTLSYHKTPYKVADLRNVRNIIYHPDTKFVIPYVGDVPQVVVSNKSGSNVNIADLTDTSCRVLLRDIKVQQSKDNLRGLLNEVRSDIGEDFDFRPTRLETVFDNGQPVTLVAFKNGEFIDSNGNSKEVRDLFNEIKADNDINVMSTALHDAHMIGLEYAGVMAIHDRIVTSSARSFTDEQVAVLNKYHQKVCYDLTAKESFDILFKQASEMPDVKDCPKQWSADALDELNDLVKGIMRNDAEVIRLK